MSAPYWGQLPQTKARRMSADYDQNDRRQSLDQPAAQSQSQPRSNRESVQTAHTDAYTESTLSPLASPATSNFTGLAPRPPSLPYGQNRYPPKLQEQQRRRASRSQDDGTHDETTTSPPPPPAAPDVPRAPPVSYKDPYRNGSPAYTPTYTYNADGQPGPPLSAYRYGSPRYGSPQARIAAMESESFYKDHTPPAEKQGRAPVLDRSRQNFDEGGAPIRQLDKDAEIRRPANGHPAEKRPADPSVPKRQGTLGAPTKRPTWADDRSPLQKLELTLDSITKEEKRARVEAAERRARERAARRESTVNQEKLQPQPAPPSGQQVRFRDRRQSEDRHEEPRAIVADPMQAQPSAAAFHGPLSQNPTGDIRQYIASDQSPRSQIPVAKNRNMPTVEKADLPQRNLSFRERAAKNDPNPSKDADSSSPVSPLTPPDEGVALARSGSNKLKKNPPGDPWYSARKEAEERSIAYQRRNMQNEEMNEPPRHMDMTNVTQPINEKARGMPPSLEQGDRPPARGKQFDQEEEYEDPPVRRKGFAAALGLGRAESMGSNQQSLPSQDTFQSSLRNPDAPRVPGGNVKSVKFPDRKHEAQAFEDGEYDSDSSIHTHGFHDYMHRGKLRPGRGMYQRPEYLEEWKKATVGTLSGPLLDLGEEPTPGVDKDTPWWEGGGKRRGSTTARIQQTDTFDGAYDDTQVPTRFKPPLYLKCGPLLRYCGLRHEKPLTRVNNDDALPDREIWRGSIMIVTQDSESSYEIPPILRLFLQPIELLPPPPAELQGELPPEYVDPIAGIPKLGRRGETLFVRPVEHLEEGKDVSRLDPDDGLFEITRSAPDFNNAPEPPGSFTSRKKRIQVDGEKLGKYKDVRGFRLHAERGHTFWRFNIEVDLRDEQQRIAYRINHGPATGFWVPARGQSMNIMFHSCNGFSLSVNSDDFSGPDPMWRDVLNNHQTRPFHVMIGGGDQVYNDAIMRDTHHFQNWLHIKNPLHKNNAPLTAEMQDEMEQFYLDRYMMWFSQGLFGLANCQIPMVNMYDDHDIIDGFGSYPHHFMKSPVFSGLGNVAFKYYMLFQHQSVPEETEETEPSWVLGVKRGPYIRELSRSLFMFLGTKVALLAVDCRTERRRNKVVREDIRGKEEEEEEEDTWRKLMSRCYDEIIKGKTEHLLVLLGVPIAYPRLVWLENILTSRLMDPIKALGKAGLLGNFLNRFDGGVEVLDDLDDHWTAKNHKDERRFVIEDLQDLAADKSVRITILSGDVHLAAVGQFYSNPKQNIPKHEDFRYIPNVISSAIANTPPPDIMADILNRRNKIHHFDKETDEDMIPIFESGVDGKPRNNKRLLPHRNWCSIREYVPGETPPPSPPPEEYDITPEGTPPGSRGGLFRRFSLSKNRGPTVRPDVPVDRSRPPISSGGGFMRSFSRRASSDGGSRPNKLIRTLSLGRGDPSRPRRGSFFSRRRPSVDRPDDGGINGDWGPDSGEEDMYDAPPPARRGTGQPTAYAPGPPPDYPGGASSMGNLRGGAGDRDRRNDEYEVGDEEYFTARPPRRAFTQPAPATASTSKNEYSDYYNRYDDHSPESEPEPPRRPFHRTPTGLTAKQLKRAGGAQHLAVDIEGGLEVCLNVEVNPKDPAGITVPYRLLVPRLWYEYQGEDGSTDELEAEEEFQMEDERGPVPVRMAPREMAYEWEERPQGGILKRLFSGRRRGGGGGGGGDGGGESEGRGEGGGGGSQYRARRQSP
ncbi:hypothetical protein F4677DRAFT_375059 [Hypoxylon crocopeplum]|nr:hypothetical protein F4677DRAFT_375059 [Hypoxylon crocopeplum]